VAAEAREEWDGVPGFWTTIGYATVKYHAWGDDYDLGESLIAEARQLPVAVR